MLKEHIKSVTSKSYFTKRVYVVEKQLKIKFHFHIFQLCERNKEVDFPLSIPLLPLQSVK